VILFEKQFPFQKVELLALVLLVVRAEKNQRQVLMVAWKQLVLVMAARAARAEKRGKKKIVGAMN
jgi:hypothetical protein